MEEEITRTLKLKLGENLLENVPLAQFTRMRVGGAADYFFVAKNIDELSRAVRAALELEVPYVVLGNASDVIFSDAGYDGLVIKNESQNVIFGLDSSEVIVDSGVELQKLINLAAGRDLGGLEFLASFQGTVGGALYSNVGTSRFSIGDFVKSVTVILRRQGEISLKSFPGNWMEFGYYSSKLKNLGMPDFKPVILTVRFQLSRRRKDEILHQLTEAGKLRRELAQQENNRIITNYFYCPKENQNADVEYLLSQINAANYRVGGAGVWRRNINSLINNRNATATDLRSLSDQIKEAVVKRFGIMLEDRAEYLGRW